MPLALAKYKEISPEDKKEVGEMAKQLITYYVGTIKKQEIDKLNNMKTKYISNTKNKMKEINEKIMSKFKKDKKALPEENKKP